MFNKILNPILGIIVTVILSHWWILNDTFLQTTLPNTLKEDKVWYFINKFNVLDDRQNLELVSCYRWQFKRIDQ